MKLLSAVLFGLFIPCIGFAETVHLSCNSGEYDVVANFVENAVQLSVNGEQYTLEQVYADAPVAFYSAEPFMRLEIGNREFQSRYTFASIVDGVPLYMWCDEVQ